MRVRLILACGVLAVLLLLLPLVGCGGIQTGSVGGYITREGGARIVDALVTIGSKTDRSDASGTYLILGLEDGKTYNGKVEKAGFHTKEFTVAARFPTAVRNIALQPL